jgi:hypothetical protein
MKGSNGNAYNEFVEGLYSNEDTASTELGPYSNNPPAMAPEEPGAPTDAEDSHSRQTSPARPLTSMSSDNTDSSEHDGTTFEISGPTQSISRVEIPPQHITTTQTDHWVQDLLDSQLAETGSKVGVTVASEDVQKPINQREQRQGIIQSLGAEDLNALDAFTRELLENALVPTPSPPPPAPIVTAASRYIPGSPHKDNKASNRTEKPVKAAPATPYPLGRRHVEQAMALMSPISANRHKTLGLVKSQSKNVPHTEPKCEAPPTPPPSHEKKLTIIDLTELENDDVPLDDAAKDLLPKAATLSRPVHKTKRTVSTSLTIDIDETETYHPLKQTVQDDDELIVISTRTQRRTRTTLTIRSRSLSETVVASAPFPTSRVAGLKRKARPV